MLDSFNEDTTKAIDDGRKYVDISKEYLKLKIFQQLAISISLVGKLMAVGSFVFIAFLLICASAAILIGAWLDNYVYGCLIVGAIALIIAYVIYKMRKKIDKTIISKLSQKF